MHITRSLCSTTPSAACSPGGVMADKRDAAKKLEILQRLTGWDDTAVVMFLCAWLDKMPPYLQDTFFMHLNDTADEARDAEEQADAEG
jgi:hypothetical protein